MSQQDAAYHHLVERTAAELRVLYAAWAKVSAIKEAAPAVLVDALALVAEDPHLPPEKETPP